MNRYSNWTNRALHERLVSLQRLVNEQNVIVTRLSEVEANAQRDLMHARAVLGTLIDAADMVNEALPSSGY